MSTGSEDVTAAAPVAEAEAPAAAAAAPPPADAIDLAAFDLKALMLKDE
jgi:hypothetical protein